MILIVEGSQECKWVTCQSGYIEGFETSFSFVKCDTITLLSWPKYVICLLYATDKESNNTIVASKNGM